MTQHELSFYDDEGPVGRRAQRKPSGLQRASLFGSRSVDPPLVRSVSGRTDGNRLYDGLAEPEPVVTLDNVFGVSRNLPLNYVARSHVDNAFLWALGQQHHIVIHGSSKQGKTCLSKKYLKDKNFVRITCSSKRTATQINEAILKEAGFSLEQSTAVTSAGDRKLNAKFEVKLKTPIVDISTGADASAGSTDQVQSVWKRLELDPADVNEVISALKSISFDGYIILEDFHYLADEVQRDFAITLKAYHEASSYCFIIIGVWLDENRIAQYNGDLTGRLVAINAARWTKEQLAEVIRLGEEHLRISFSEEFKEYVLDHCFDSVWVVQQTCRRACMENGVLGQGSGLCGIGSRNSAEALIAEVVDAQSARCNMFIKRFAQGIDETSSDAYRWILGAVLGSDPNQLENGLTPDDIHSFVNIYRLDGVSLDSNWLTNSLEVLSRLQVDWMSITPIVFDYDQTTRRLSVVDRGFLIWLSGQDRVSLLRQAGLPSNSVRKYARQVTERTNRHYRM